VLLDVVLFLWSAYGYRWQPKLRAAPSYLKCSKFHCLHRGFNQLTDKYRPHVGHIATADLKSLTNPLENDLLKCVLVMGLVKAVRSVIMSEHLRGLQINTVLIITDDDPAIRKLLGKAAEASGWNVVLCESAEELLKEMGSSLVPVLLFLDIHMAEKDGIEVIEDLKLIDRKFRLRFMTGGKDTHAVAARMIATARDLDVGTTLYKPFSLERFREAIDVDMALLT